MKRWQSSLTTGLVYGAFWGIGEALVHQLRYLLGVWADSGVWMPIDGAGLLAVLVLAAMRYALVGVVVCWLGSLLFGWLVARGQRAEYAPARVFVTVMVAANLFWWLKPLFAFSDGLPFYHPSRVALSAGWVIFGLVTALVLVRPGRLGPPGRRAFLTACVVLFGLGPWAAWREAGLTNFTERAAPEGRAPNVLLVVVDALRGDRLGCYGYERDPPTSPHVDAMAAEGVVFERAVVQAPFTWTSFGSFLTGKYPREHGLMRMRSDQRLDPKRNRTIAQALQDEGYVCGAFLTGTLSNNSGLLAGFDTYFEQIVGHVPVTRSSKWSIARSDMLLYILYNKIRQHLDVRLVNTEALRWIREQQDRPFFAMVHYYSTHTPYDPPAPYKELYDPDYEGIYKTFTQSYNVAIGRGDFEFTERDLVRVNALYDGGLAFADEMFGSLLDLLDELEIADDTLVIFTSDHGEELYDHKVFEHDWMFNTNLYVPLVVRFPDGVHAGRRVPWHVEAMDIPATVVEVAGRGTLDPGDGRSLVPDAGGTEPPAEERAVFSENNRYVAMLDDEYKLVANREVLVAPELLEVASEKHKVRVFDLTADPDELHPIEAGDLRRRLFERMLEYDGRMPSLSSMPTFAIDPSMAERLRQLGYVEGYLGPNEQLEEDLYESSGGAADDPDAASGPSSTTDAGVETDDPRADDEGR